jgi:hypothetical protein
MKTEFFVLKDPYREKLLWFVPTITPTRAALYSKDNPLHVKSLSQKEIQLVK